MFGFFMTIAGAALGGVLVVRYGILRPLLTGAILVAATNLLFVWLAISDPDLVSLAIVISADNLSGGFATSAFIAWLSSLTNTAPALNVAPSLKASAEMRAGNGAKIDCSFSAPITAGTEMLVDQGMTASRMNEARTPPVT